MSHTLERTLAGLPRRIVLGRPRLFIGLICGLVAYPLLPSTMAAPVTRAILAWDIGVLVFLIGIGQMFAAEHLSRMAHDAARQQEGEWTIFALVVGAIVFSFAAILFDFGSAKDMPAAEKNLHVALVAATLVLSWLMTQTTFALRYAHEYYEAGGGKDGYVRGLEFPSEDRPDYLDFMYFSLVLGMTFQVSDVQITSRKFRRLAALHGLLGFFFNTIIIALTVNIAAGLL